MPFRLYGVEEQVKTLDNAHVALSKAQALASQAITAQGVTLAAHEERIITGRDGLAEVKSDIVALAVSVSALAEKVAASTNRVAWTLTGLAFTVAGSAIVLVLTGQPS